MNKMCRCEVFVGVLVVIIGLGHCQRLSGSGKDYLQQTEQGPWFTGSCKLSNEILIIISYVNFKLTF